jgi:glycosyltransferase involved in cell wall biosynthesis
MAQTRIMYVLHGYPQASQTYIKTELEAVSRDYDVRIVSTHQEEVTAPYRNHLPYDFEPDLDRVRGLIEDFRPHVLHSHHLREIKRVAGLARETGVPFTIRSHSFDVLRKPKRISNVMELIEDDLCLGIIAFPFAAPLFVERGAPEDKVIECWPVVNYERFHDRSPNGEAIMNCGAAIPKKDMPAYIDLAAEMPERQFDLYALGYKLHQLEEYNEQRGRPVEMKANVEPDDMPAEYKKHEWLVYTANAEMKTVGWPMAVAEAQAAGVGVCMQNIRPDLREYVGEAGFLFDTVQDVKDIISRPFPDELREIGFEHARRSDIREHLPALTGLWERATARVG